MVDCPGHASLIRTIIAGAQIIDAMMLVVDVTKGFQTQTAECLVIGEILCDHLLLVLNKIDLLPPEKSKATIEKMIKRIRATLQSTKFANCKIIPVAAKPGGGDETCSVTSDPLGMSELLAGLQNMFYIPKRETMGPVVFAVDHCFGIRGQGTVMTGTVLQGSVAINDTVEIPSLNISKKVKSMQMFYKPVERAIQGDRLGICVTQFDPKTLERGLACTPGLIKTATALLVLVEKIPYYKQVIETKAKFHISVGNETVMAKVYFFGSSDCKYDGNFDNSREYAHQDELIDVRKTDDAVKPCHQFAVLQLERSVPVLPGSFIIGSKLDMDVHTNMCRLAFKGTILEIYTSKDYADTQLPLLKVFKNKSKDGVVERMQDTSDIIVKNLLKKDTNLQLFIGLKVTLSTGEIGIIEGHFGTSGKLKVRVPSGLQASTCALLHAMSGGKKKGKGSAAAMQNLSLDHKPTESIKVQLNFKKYVFAGDKKMVQ